MRRHRHKRKVRRIIILTTDAVNAKTRLIRVHPFLNAVLTVFICGFLGGLIGYITYEGQLWEMNRKKQEEQAMAYAALEEEKQQLEMQLQELNTQIEALSLAVNERAHTADELQEELQQQSLPTNYPLTGSAGIEEVREGDPMVIFSASEGITVVASAKGVVRSVEEDETYGYCITVDHGNGYLSLYYNGGEAQVKAGDEVASGTTLFLVGTENKQLAYQIMLDGVYINPMDMLSING